VDQGVFVVEEGFALTAFIAVILDLVLPEEFEDDEIPMITANHVDDRRDEEEWSHVKHEGQDEITPTKA